MRSCDSKPETTAHFLLHCQHRIIRRPKLLKSVYNLDQFLRNYDYDHLTHIFLYSSEKFKFNLKGIIKLTF